MFIHILDLDCIMAAEITYIGVIWGADFIFGGDFVRIHQFSMILVKITTKCIILLNFAILLRFGPNESRNRAQRIELPPNPPFHHILVHFNIDKNFDF